jgi:glucan biosynthesis protein C
MDLVRALPFPPPARRPGLDALRAIATVLVVLLHAGVPYSLVPMPGLTWPVRNTAVSSVVDAIFWSIEGAIMPLFFLLSGYGAAQSLAGKPVEFLASRWRRLGWPLVAAAAVLLPLEFYIWLTGWALDGEIPWHKLRSLSLGRHHDNLWGLSHLWYLEYLLIFSGMLWVARRQAGTLLRSVANGRVLFALTAITLWFEPETVVGFQHSFLPVPAKFIYSGLFFAAGVLEFHRPTKVRVPLVLTAVVCGLLQLAMLPLIHRQADEPLVGPEKLALVLGMAAYAVAVSRLAWRWAWNSQRPLPPAVSYLARASFWIYLVHHPLVALGHIALRPTGWPALVQFTLCTLGTLAISLASYEWLVRQTRIGAFLEGRAAPQPMSTPEPARRAA